MKYQEKPITFQCAGDTLIGSITVPDTVSTSTGVLVIVGGPQYRVGSHRQFVLLARTLASSGIPCMRFDCRGMGDSTGTIRTFDDIDDDIRAALDTFYEQVPQVHTTVLWGLCDAASAACFFVPHDNRVSGLVLLNPWVRTESGAAKTRLKHYYWQRILSRAFWKKLLRGGIQVRSSAAAVVDTIRLTGQTKRAHHHTASPPRHDLPSRMAADLLDAKPAILLILSGRDYVANEFEEITRTRKDWSEVLAMASIQRYEAADHTFSRREWRHAIADSTIEWVKRHIQSLHQSNLKN